MNLPGAIPQRAPLTVRLAEWVKRVTRARTGGERDTMPVHLHDRPRITAYTDHGILTVRLLGACLYEDALVFRFWLVSAVDCRVGAFDVRFGKNEAKITPPETLEVKAGVPMRIGLAARLMSLELGSDEPDTEGKDGQVTE